MAYVGHRTVAACLLGAGLVLGAIVADGAALKASGPVPSPPPLTSGCPTREKLAMPSVGIVHAPDRLEVTLDNSNACYGYLDEAVEIAYYGAQGKIASYGKGCCRATLPPHARWQITLPYIEVGGCVSARTCEVRVIPVSGDRIDAWRRMPESDAHTVLGTYRAGR